jgi:TonB family protein
MRHPRFMIIGAGIALAWGSVRAEEVKIIANPSVKASEITVRDLKGIFLRERNSLSDGTHVEPVLEKRGPAHETFVKQYLDESGDQLAKHYQGLVFSGMGSMPKAVGSDEEMVAYVASTKGAIGYVSAETTTTGVKGLEVVNRLNQSERRLLTRVVPGYPTALRARAIGGIVRLKIAVEANGDVQDVEVLGGNPILGEFATAAVQKWKYAAASSRTTMEVSIPFDPQH